jgi:hypothetical protein
MFETTVPVPIKSSALRSATYDAEERILEITFRNGRSYTYRDVPPDVVFGLASAQSQGDFYNANIKGQY